MKASSKDKEFYWLMLDKILFKIVRDGTIMCKEELHEFLKDYADLNHVSLSPTKPNAITHEELQILKEYTKQFAISIGMAADEFDKYQEQNEK